MTRDIVGQVARRQVLRMGVALPLVGAGSAAWAQGAPEAGPFEIVTVDRLDLVDAPRQRTVITRIVYPARPGRYPVIIHSHGFGGSYKTLSNTAAIWASHGYVVMLPTHSDSIGFPDPNVPAVSAATQKDYLAATRDGAMTAELRGRFVKLLDDPYFMASRLADVALLQAAVAGKVPGMDPAVVARADVGRMGMSGHSYGGYTTLVVGGAALKPPSATPVPKGFSGFIVMSGQGPGRMSLHDDSFSGMTGPTMFTTGTRDFGAAGETPEWRLKPYDLAPPGRKYAVWVDGFRHGDFDQPAGDPDHAGRSVILRRMHLDFWRAALKGDAKGYKALDAIAATSTKTDPVWLRRK